MPDSTKGLRNRFNGQWLRRTTELSFYAVAIAIIVVLFAFITLVSGWIGSLVVLFGVLGVALHGTDIRNRLRAHLSHTREGGQARTKGERGTPGMTHEKDEDGLSDAGPSDRAVNFPGLVSLLSRTMSAIRVWVPALIFGVVAIGLISIAVAVLGHFLPKEGGTAALQAALGAVALIIVAVALILALTMLVLVEARWTLRIWLSLHRRWRQTIRRHEDDATQDQASGQRNGE
jgi:hypothetical protein